MPAAGRTRTSRVALGGIIAAGALYTLIGLVVMKVGYAWIETLMPPAVTGAVVAVIGLNLAPIAVKGISGSTFDTWIGIATIVAVGLVAVRAPRARAPPADPARRPRGLSRSTRSSPTASAWASRSTSPRVAAAPWFGLPNFVGAEVGARRRSR